MEKKVLAIVLVCVLLLVCVSCGKQTEKDVWEQAIYKEDTTFGKGNTTVQVEVVVEDHSVTFTIQTDETILGNALLAHNLISGDQGAYGLYVKYVNGMQADYDIDQHYWGFYQNGEYMLTGVDQTTIENGNHYELVYSK